MTDYDTHPLALQPPATVMHVRPVILEDVVALRVECWAHRTAMNSKDVIRRVIAAHARKRGLGLVVQPQIGSDQIIGYGQLLYWGQSAEISDLIVAPTYRQQGIGTALIQHLTQYAIQHAMQRVEIGVALSNPRALALYLRMGFMKSYQLMLNLANGKEPVQYLQLELPQTG